MALERDFVLIGSGIAPLVAAADLIARGKSVLVLNPDTDFFREDSELPLDPLWPITPQGLVPQKILKNLPERAIEILGKNYPGAVELFQDQASIAKFHDPKAPHVKSRARLWVKRDWGVSDFIHQRAWEQIEAMYVECSDAGLHPQVLEGMGATKRFPGMNAAADIAARGILLPKFADVDVSRYRNGLLDYVYDRLSSEGVFTNVSQIDLVAEGVRFRVEREGHIYSQTIKLGEGVLIFWTPRLNTWVRAQIEKPEILPQGMRIWEEWGLVSKTPTDSTVVGSFEEFTIWTDFEGLPQNDPNRLTKLSALRGSFLAPYEHLGSLQSRPMWGTQDSFAALARLCHDFLKWESFSIRSLKPRIVFEWQDKTPADQAKVAPVFLNGQAHFKSRLVGGVEGPLVEVVSQVHRILGEYS